MKALTKPLFFLLLALLLLSVAPEAGGQEKATGSLEPQTKTEDTGLSRKGAQITAFFLLLGIVAYGAITWQKRRGKSPGTTIQVVAVKPLGQREKVAVLEVLGERMVLGITAHRISLLHHGASGFAGGMREEDRKA